MFLNHNACIQNTIHLSKTQCTCLKTQLIHVSKTQYTCLNTTQDMEYFLKPLMNREPNHIVLHVGINNLGEQEPQDIAENIQILAKQITELGIGSSVSSIITRRDGLSEKASKVNVLLRKSLPSKIELIDHSSITEGHLNGSGLHLNQRGDGAMAFNLMKHIRETEK